MSADGIIVPRVNLAESLIAVIPVLCARLYVRSSDILRTCVRHRHARSGLIAEREKTIIYVC